jgi:sterol 3beta-glucosyltransferase
MHITILTYGSRGDVQPFLALAIGLQKAGHHPRLAAPARFKAFVEGYGIPFINLAGDPGIISQRLNEAGANPIRMVRAISDYIFSISGQVLEQALNACQDTELIVHSFLFTTGGHSLARKLGIPDLSVQTFPVFAPTRALPPVYAPGLKAGFLRKVFHQLTTQLFWHGGNLGFRKMQKEHPPKYDLELRWPFLNRAQETPTPLVFAFSPRVVPRPEEWNPSQIHIPGYFFLDALETYHPSDDLVTFLRKGSPPVCITFGSMINREAARIYRTVLKAVQATHTRAIILSGWGPLDQLSSSQDIFITESVPHDWLLPQCKAVIHHGGAGTTAAGLRAGIPNLVVPFAADQPFWGTRVHELGCGPRPIPVKKLTEAQLVFALREAERLSICTRASKISQKIREEEGIGRTIKLIETFPFRKQRPA